MFRLAIDTGLVGATAQTNFALVPLWLALVGACQATFAFLAGIRSVLDAIATFVRTTWVDPTGMVCGTVYVGQ